MSVIDRLRELEAKASRAPWVPIRMKDGTARRYIRAADCEFGFGLPITDAEFIVATRNALTLLLRVAEAADRMTPGADDWHWSDSMRDELHAAVRALRSEP